MPTNLALDDALIEKAKRLGRHRTKKEAVTAALEEYVKRRGRLRILELAGTLRTKAEFDAEKVLAAARDALRREFGFTAREFGQSVAMSAVLATLHRIPGVESVDLDHLQRTDRLETENPAPRLAADLPVGGVNSTVPTAELLTLREDSLLNLTLAP